MTMRSLFLAAAVALSAGALFGSTSYVIPWYVNPGTKVKLYTGSDTAFDTVDLRFGEKGDRLFALMNTADGARAIAYDMDKLGTLTGIQTNWHNGVASYTTAFPASERVVVSSARNAYVAVNPSDGTGFEAPAGHSQWIGRFAPTTLSFGSGAVAATSFAFDSTGDVLWSNSTADGETGRLVKWTCSNGAFSSVVSHATGLDTVEAVAVYTVDGVEYILAAAQGTVKFINAASGAVKFTVGDADHLGATVKAVRMSHCDYFRPRLYVLLANGDVAAYYLNRELTKATWSKTNSNAKLLAAAGAPYGADDATIVAFDVTPDGGTAAVGFAKNAGSEATVEGPMYVTLLKHEPRKWILYETNDDRNPFKGQFAVMSDGEWYLRFHWSGNGEVWVGASGTSWAQRAWTGNEFPEYLDFSHGYSYKATDNERHAINGNEQYGFATNSVVGKGPRALVHSPTMTFFNDKCKGWSGAGNYEEVVIDCPNLTWGSSWSGPDKQSQRIIYNFASMPTGYANMIYPNNGNYYGGESDWSEVTLTKMTKVLSGCFSHFDAKGTLALPAVQVVSNSAFSSCRYMEEAKLGETSKSLQQLWNSAFSGCSRLKRVTLGGAAGFTFKASNVFASCPLEEVTFTGAVPTFANDTVSWPDTAEKTMTFAVPRGNAEWKAILDDPSKVKSRLSLAEQQAYRLAHPGQYVPVGILDKSVLKTKYDQYIAYNDMKGGVALTIERDTFFDDEVEITSDWAPAPDGTYLPGTTVTLTAKPNATGTFVQWYGDVSREDEKNPQITVKLDGDTWLYCRIVHPWTLSSTKNRLTNGNFTLICSVKNSTSRTLQIATGSKYGLFADEDVGQGVVDLGGPITLANETAQWTIVGLAGGSPMIGKRGGKGSGVTTLVFPGTLTTTPSSQWMHATTSDPYGISYKTLIMDEPAITGNPFPSWSTCGHYDLAHLVLRIPKATALSGDPSFWNISAEKSKFEWWDVSSLNNIAYRAFCGYDWSNRLLCSGKLTLPSYCTIVKNSLSVLKNVEEISLGGRDKTTTVKSIDVSAFAGDSALRKLTIHNDESLTVANANVFSAGKVPGEIVLTGKVPTTDIFANLLGSATAAATKPVKVYVSSGMGWANRPSYIDAPTEAERAEAPGEFVLGVYRGGAEAPNGKALIIHRAGPFDPRGTCLFLR